MRTADPNDQDRRGPPAAAMMCRSMSAPRVPVPVGELARARRVCPTSLESEHRGDEVGGLVVLDDDEQALVVDGAVVAARRRQPYGRPLLLSSR